jgi:hypothetical protein
MSTLRFPQIVILHGENDLPTGSPARLHSVLHGAYPDINFNMPFIPNYPTMDAFDFVRESYAPRIQTNALLVGFERGGLLACALQEKLPALHLSVFAINAPTHEGDIAAHPVSQPDSRVAVYSCAYEPIQLRCEWQTLTRMAYDVPWLSKGNNYFALTYLISAYLRGKDMTKELEMMFPPEPILERKPYPGVTDAQLQAYNQAHEDKK